MTQSAGNERRTAAKIALPAVLLILACSLLLDSHFVKLSDHSPQYTLEAGAPHLKQSGAQFAKDIREFGGKAAYARLGAALAGMNIDDQHAYSHEFGHQLYSIEGEKGIAACDGNYGLGCFHQFLGDAIADLGTGAVQRLYDECAATVGNQDDCKHGLGHGIVAGLGYTEPDLKKAIALCDGLTGERSYSGCAGGAFMEYNMRVIAVTEGAMGRRLASSSEIYEPCTSLDPADRQTCTFWLPQWWYYNVLPESSAPAQGTEAYRKMGAMCLSAPDRRACYEGIGYFAPMANGFDAGKIRAACDSLGSAHDGDLYCRGMAALIIYLTAHTPGETSGICEGLEPSRTAACIRYGAHNPDFSPSLQ